MAARQRLLGEFGLDSVSMQFFFVPKNSSRKIWAPTVSSPSFTNGEDDALRRRELGGPIERTLRLRLLQARNHFRLELLPAENHF